ncbi:hypothetical protein ATE92_0168 [Ulvibacter sp. MAR_2010_11]|nr:hypothetical protein ATE92_0168 [Ulvibacter sp. MAR_2010_11]
MKFSNIDRKYSLNYLTINKDKSINEIVAYKKLLCLDKGIIVL